MEFRVLGPLEAIHQGSTMDLGPQKQRRALAALLAAPSRTRTADQLIHEIWQEQPPNDPQSSLYAYISRLRKLLKSGGEGNRIERKNDSYRLEISSSTVDAELFERDVESLRNGQMPLERQLETIESALNRWYGDPFADMSDSELIAARATRLSAMRRELEELQVRMLSQAGFDARALAAAQGVAARYPFDERVQALVMLTLYRAGRQADALRHFKTVRDLLIEELGVDPGAELCDLEQKILNHHPDLARQTTGPAPAASAKSTSELIGRGAEMSILLAALERHDDVNRTVLVTGEPGIGKTHLIRELAAHARNMGHRLIWVQSQTGPRGAALLPVAFAVAELAQELTSDQFDQVVGNDPTALAPLLASGGLPAGGSPPIDFGDDLARYRTEEAVGRNLGRLAELGPVLVVVDDLQWASQAMIELLIRLSARNQTWPVTFVAACRWRRPDHVTAGLRTLRQTPGFVEVELTGLDLDAIRQLARRAVGPMGDNIASDVRIRTNGNPLFANELLRALDREDPVGSLASPKTPASVAEAVLAHIQELPPEVGDVLTVAALMGPTFEPALCAEIAGHGKRVSQIIETALASGLIEDSLTYTPRCTFRHDLVRTAISSKLSHIRKAQIHSRIGQALLARHQASDAPKGVPRGWGSYRRSITVIAEHLCGGASFGTAYEGAHHASQAAQAALRHDDAIEAERLAVLGLHALGHVASSAKAAQMEAQLYCDQAEALQRLFRNKEALGAARQAFSIALANGIIDLAIQALRIFAGQTAGAWLGFWSHSDEIIEMAERLLHRVGPLEKLRPNQAILLIGPYSEALTDHARFDEVDQLTTFALESAEQIDDPATKAEAAERRLAYLEMTPSIGERVYLSRRMLSVAGRSERFSRSARRHLINYNLEMGDLAGAERELCHLETLAQRLDSSLVELEAAYCRTAIDLLLGRLTDAEQRIEATQRRFDYLDRSRLDALGLQRLWLMWDQGTLALAEDSIRQRLSGHDTHSWRAPLMLVLLDSGRIKEASEIIESMAPSEFQHVSESPLHYMTPTLLSEIVVALDDRPRANWLLGLLSPVAHRMVAFYGGTLYLGWASLPVGRLLGVLERFDEAQDHLTDSVIRAERLGSKSFGLRARTALAELELRQGRTPEPSLEDLEAEADGYGYVGIGNWCRRLGKGIGLQ